MIKTIHSLDEVWDFAWELSRNELYASYPRRDIIEELKLEIEKAINLDTYDIIAFYQHEVLCGVCFYFWHSNEKYAQTTGLLIREDYGKIADEFINYIRKQLPGYELFIGLPITNKHANEYFIEKKVKCIESSIVTRICNLEPRINQGYDCIEKISESNFEEYAVFHDKYAIPKEMYCNSKNLQKEIERFLIFVYRQDGDIHGSIFVKTGKVISEVYGLFIDKEYKNIGIESKLINVMLIQLYNEFGSVKELLYFIDEGSTDELNIAMFEGFEIKETYRCYKCIL